MTITTIGITNTKANWFTSVQEYHNFVSAASNVPAIQRAKLAEFDTQHKITSEVSVNGNVITTKRVYPTEEDFIGYMQLVASDPTNSNPIIAMRSRLQWDHSYEEIRT